MFKSILVVLCFLSSFAVAAEKAPLELALNWKAEPQFGGFYTADLKGEFSKRNLHVHILEGGSGTPTVQMLANGKVNYAVVGAEEIILANERNPENKVIALFASYQIAPHILMSHAERNFKNIKDIFTHPGNLAIQAGLPYFLFLQQKFGKPLVVKIVPYSGGISNFLQDPQFSQQGFATSEPLLAKKAGAKVSVFRVADEGFNPYTTILAVSEKTLKAHPDQAKAMVEAVRAGWSGYLLDSKPTDEMMSKINKAMDLQTFHASAEAQKDLIQTKDPLKLGQMTDARWESLSDQMQKLGLTKIRAQARDLYKNLD
jgi:NitT/TauT family transport system substrate-binding protein